MEGEISTAKAEQATEWQARPENWGGNNNRLFISRDPIGIADDVNLYGYVGGNPVNATDVAGGVSTCVETAGAGCVIGAYGASEVVQGGGEMRDGIYQVIYGQESEQGQKFADKFDWINNGLDGVGANCKTKQMVAVGLMFVNPEGGGAKAGAEGFKSFSAFKRFFGRAGDGMQWHHIVEQHWENIMKFGSEMIHNPNNLIKLPTEIHREVTKYYNSAGIRQYVKNLSIEEQYKFGVDIINKFGGGKFLK